MKKITIVAIAVALLPSLFFVKAQAQGGTPVASVRSLGVNKAVYIEFPGVTLQGQGTWLEIPKGLLGLEDASLEKYGLLQWNLITHYNHPDWVEDAAVRIFGLSSKERSLIWQDETTRKLMMNKATALGTTQEPPENMTHPVFARTAIDLHDRSRFLFSLRRVYNSLTSDSAQTDSEHKKTLTEYEGALTQAESNVEKATKLWENKWNARVLARAKGESNNLGSDEKSIVDQGYGGKTSISQGTENNSKRALTQLHRPAVPESQARLDSALGRLYGVANGDRENRKVDAAKLTTQQRIAFFRSEEFKEWVASEKAQGRQVFWLRDMDKTQTAGDIFTFFFRWRAENGKITPAQNETLKAFLKTVKVNDVKLKEKLSRVDQNDAATNGKLIIELWRSKEAGGEGMSLLQLWLDVYWPTQSGLTRKEKEAQATQFAPYFASKVYPGVREENLSLRQAGVEVVLVSFGDQELAKAVAPLLGIKPANTVGAFLKYDEKGMASGLGSDGLLHTYERFDKESATKPQNGKPLLFHYWLHGNRHRFGWEDRDFDERVIIAGADGDSASTDGGMMMPLYFWPIGNFMIDTPHEPNRIQKFYAMAEKYRSGRFFTLTRDPSSPAAWEGASLEVAPFSSLKPLHLKSVPTRIAYSVLNKVVDWSKGHTTVFVGRKRQDKTDGAPYSSEEFLIDLKNHVGKTLVALRKQGLLGYIVYATEEMEFAIMHWESEDRMNKTFQSDKGKAVAADAGRIFESQPMVRDEMNGFTGALTTEAIETYLKRVGR